MSADAARAEEALARVGSALHRVVDSGLERLTTGTLDELRELERVAHQGRLTRIERELATMTTLGDRYLARDPSFHPGAWVGACEKLAALCVGAGEALTLPEGPEREQILGVPRRTYLPVNGIVRVFALGASGWVSESGYCGITVHLWDGRRVLQATQARPVALVGSDPRRLLYQTISEDTPISIQELAHGAWDLDDVRLSSDGRLSMHAGLKAVPAAPIGLRAYEAFMCADVTAVVERVASRTLDPLGMGAPVLAMIEIGGVRAVGIDETHARGVAEVMDRAGHVLEVDVPLRPEHDQLLENLARMQTLRPLALFGRVFVGGRAVRIEPYTAIFGSPVALRIRRRMQVQEVHLGLEPLDGEGTVPRAAPKVRREPSPSVQQVSRALRPVAQLIERLYGTGLALLDPELIRELAATAEAWTGAGIEGLGAALRRLVRALEGEHRAEAHAALHALTTQLRLFREGLTIHEVRHHLQRTEVLTEAPGEELDLVPLGAEVTGARLVIHTLEKSGGGYVLLEDEWPGFDRTAAFERAWPSRLFQADVTLRDVLTRALRLHNHPVSRAPDRCWVRPYVRSPVTLGPLAVVETLPARPSPRSPFRAPATAHRDPNGWWLDVAGAPPVLVDDPWLQIDLEKRAVRGPVRMTVDAALRRDRLVVLAVEGTWPTLDPTATTFSLEQVRDAAAERVRAAVDRLQSGVVPPVVEEPADPSLPDRVAALRRGIERGAVLPPVVELRLLADAWCRANEWDRSEHPIRRLGLPRERIWLAIVAPVARWLGGEPVPDEQVADALDLAAAAGERAVLFG